MRSKQRHDRVRLSRPFVGSNGVITDSVQVGQNARALRGSLAAATDDSRRSLGGSGKPLKRTRLIPVLAQQVTGICPDLPIAGDSSRWPGDLDGLDPIGLAQAEGDARGGGRLVAASADTPGNAAPAAGDNGDLRPDGIAIRPATFQAQGQ